MAEQTINLAHSFWVIDQTNAAQQIAMDNHSWGICAVISCAENEGRQVVGQITGTLSNTYKYNKLVSARLNIPWLSVESSSDTSYVDTWLGIKVTDGVGTTWATAEAMPSTQLGMGYGHYRFDVPTQVNQTEYFTAASESETAHRLLHCGSFYVYPADAAQPKVRFWQKYNTYYLTKLNVVVDDAVTVTSKATGADKTSGYVNPNNAQTFSWTFEHDGDYYCYGTWTQASATFKWRVGTSGAWTSVTPDSATTQSVTLPANTMTAEETIQWCVEATDSEGTTSTSDIYTITTAAAAITCTPVSPVDVIVDNSASNAFTWSSASSDGQAQTAAQLQYSTDGTNWSTLASVADSSTSVDVAGGTLPSGVVYWRVRGANVDGTYGPWSSSVSFVSYGAPAAPTVSATATSYTTVTWQSNSQQAYRVTIDGTVYGPFFGETKTFSPEDYLSDGTHTVSVEVQNSFGLWSQKGTATITVSTPVGYTVPQITASKFGVDARITWSISNAATTTAVYLYRDNIKIAKLNFSDGNGTYTDTHVLGKHYYKVVQRYLDYALVSNIVTGAMKSCTTRIAPLAGGSWLELELSDNSNRTEDFSYNKYVSLRHFSGAQWPVAEIGVSADEACTYDVSFPDVASANAFEALRGKAVIIKSRGGQVMVGILSDLQKSMTEFYIRFQFSIQRIHWEDFTDETS